MSTIETHIMILVAFVSSCSADEVFLSEGRPTDAVDYEGALERCANLGAHLATKDELRKYPKCHCGWTLDKTVNYYIDRKDAACGNRIGLHECRWRDRWNAYCFKGAFGNCSRPLGIEDGTIHESQIYASSEFHIRYVPLLQVTRWSASIARLHNRNLVNAWMPKYDGRKQWLEVDFELPTVVTGIVTQGASKFGTRMWVESYIIEYSKDGNHYKYIQEPNGSREKVFEGNSNNNGLKRNMFPKAVLARYIRFRPRSYHGHIALRLELLGCDLQTYVNSHTAVQSTVATATDDPLIEHPPEDSD